MMCRVCHGSGSFFARQMNLMTKQKEYRWFSCPSCNGLGTITVDAPVKIRMGNRLNKQLVKLNKQLDFDDKNDDSRYIN